MTSTNGLPHDPPRVLVIEDEAAVMKFLRVTLVADGFQIVEATNGKDGLRLAEEEKPDLVLLDLGLPDLDGMEVTARLREWTQTPILVISARGNEHDKVKALDAGADDYLTKPFGNSELMARIRAALRRSMRTASDERDAILVVGDLTLDHARRLVRVGEREVRLTPIEFKLLAILMQNAGKVMTHRQLLTEVWGPRQSEETQYLRVYMKNLRHKIEKEPARPRQLVTEPGVGYRLKE